MLRDVREVVGEVQGLSRTVLEYSLVMKELVDAGKQPGFSEASWAPLARMVDTRRFERIGNFKEVMGWDDYVSFLTRWVRNAEWECSFQRIAETGNRVFLELEERTGSGAAMAAVNSMSVYEFDASGKLFHLDIYLQMALPPELMPPDYR